ncbi:MAG: hypothetical protein HQL56_14505, partial [Magnetococcales bacterium]|nr:hypothetical protein [Magnetococcales bacterium]
ELLAKGRAEGEARGEARGMVKGESAVLLRQIQLKFGTLPAWVRDRVAGAGLPELTAWTDRILDAGSLEELLGKPETDSSH